MEKIELNRDNIKKLTIDFVAGDVRMKLVNDIELHQKLSDLVLAAADSMTDNKVVFKGDLTLVLAMTHTFVTSVGNMDLSPFTKKHKHLGMPDALHTPGFFTEWKAAGPLSISFSFEPRK